MNILIVLGLSCAETYALFSVAEPIRGLSWPQAYLLFFIVQFTAIQFYHVFIYPFLFSPIRHLPGPNDGHIFLGQTWKLFKAKPAERQIKWMHENPDVPFIRYLTLGNTETLLVVSAKAHKEVLQAKCYSFVKPPFWARLVGEIAGLGLLFAEGDAHKKQRRLLATPFNFSNIKNLLPFFNLKASELSSVIDDEMRKNSTGILEITSLVSKAALDIVSLAALGYHLNSLSKTSLFEESYHKMFEMGTVGKTITLVNQFIPLRSWLPLAANKEFLQAKTNIRRLLYEHIQRRKTEVSEKGNTAISERSGRDLLTLMIEERASGANPWTEDEILNHLLNFMSAGHETTAGSVAWALHSLTLYPEMQRRLRDEINTIMPHSNYPSYDEIESLPFLNNLVREVLRFYPPAVAIPRQADEDVMICGIMVPKGTVVMIVPAVIHYNELIWGPNAAKFDPDRYDNLPEAAQDPYVSQAFLAGPRICIGKAFALLEFKAIMVELIKNFDFERTDKPVEVQSGITLRPVGGLELRIKRVNIV